MSDEEEHKPCPFCGGSDRLSHRQFDGYCIACRNCGASGPTCDTPDEAMDAWETRA